MKKLKLSWFEYLQISILALGFIFVFIPVSPWTTSEPGGEVTYHWFSLLTFTINLTPNLENYGLYWALLVLFLVFSMAGIVLIVFKKKLLFKISLLAATFCVMFFARKGWAINVFVSVVAVVYLSLLLAVLIVEGFRNRREIADRASKEKYDNQNSDNQD